MRVSQCPNTTDHGRVKHFLQSKPEMSHASIFDTNLDFDTCSGIPALNVCIVIVIVILIIFIINCFLTSKHQTTDKHELTGPEREPRYGANIV